MNDQHLGIVQRADPDRLLGAAGERVRPVQRPGAQLVAIEIARAHVQQRRAQLILTGLRVLFDETDVLKGPQQPVDGSLRQAELAGEIDDAEAAGSPREQPQDGRRALDRLDIARHAAPSDLGGVRGLAAHPGRLREVIGFGVVLVTVGSGRACRSVRPLRTTTASIVD